MKSTKKSKKVLNVPHLRFKEFSGEWEKNRLSEYAEFLQGLTYTPEQVSDNTGYLVLRSSNIKNSLLAFDDNVYVKMNIPKRIKTFENDVLMCVRNGSKSLVGKNALITKNYIGLAWGAFMNILRPKDKTVFLFHFLNTESFKRQIKIDINTATVNQITLQMLNSCNIYLPVVDERLKISHFLNLINNRLETQMKIIKEIKSLIYSIKNKIIEKLIFVKWIKIKDICTITTGKLDANAMKENGKYKFFTCSKDDYYINEYAFDGEALIISGNGELGLIKYYNGKFNAYQRTYVLQNFKLSPIYIKFMMEYYLPRKIYKEKNVGAMPYIVLSTIAELEIPVVDNRIIEKMERFYLLLNKRQNIDNIQLNNLKKQKQFLLNNMFI